MATKKKFKKMIKMLASSMPVILDHTHEYHIVSGEELIEQGHTDIREGEKVNPGKKYKQAMPVLIARNHENRIKQAYLSNGKNGVSEYVREVRGIVNSNT